MELSAFETIADTTLGSYAEIIDEAIGDVADVDFQSGILTIELDSGGQYVINKQAPTRQVWVSSPVSGASHFTYEDGVWRATRSDDVLAEMLSKELTDKTGVTVAL
ncbi:iron donor protein CyaY [Magnetospira sp. QH-2]|uniref:iron donor protein CyaY n=1 Tax=Magnetospira sp. (strain QH-2) TaxID=1288970 RepID=UPI0003E80C55|nr:iron donor protein CyaY [Magnetospira sp. QH-2]CCQ74062.1 Putative iron-sulphur cluster (FeS) metabolism CyaY proteins [cyaY] [Magnetospira sp. QH-2]